MKRLKLLTLVGTRPELIKLSLTIREADKHFDQVLVHTGQNFDFELNEIFFRDLGIRRPDRFLEAAAPNAAETIAKVIQRLDGVLEADKPDALLLLGDTNSCLGVIAAKRRKIPIFHMEAGNRCFDQRVPEEINRKVVDHLSDVNLPYTEHARRYLLAEGFPADRVIKTGSPMGEVLRHFATSIDASSALSNYAVEPMQYIVVSAHREENVDDGNKLGRLMDALNEACVHFKVPILFSVHPRTRSRLEGLKDVELDPNVRLLKPLGFFDYVKLQKNALCVVSDSGTLTEECALLGFPAVMIREAHERPEGMDEGIVIRSDLDTASLLACLELSIAHARDTFTCPSDYLSVDVSKKVVRLIQSYTGYVNRTVWHKEN